MTRKRFIVLFTILFTILSFSGCSAFNDADSADTVATAANTTALGDFKAEDVKGNEVTKEIFSNYDLTLVNLFTTWCSPCISEIPHLSEIQKEFSDKGVNVIGIVLDVNEDGKTDEDKMKKLNEIIESTNAGYTIVLPDSVLREGRLKNVDSVPETFFVDKDGNIVGETYVGAHSKEEWIEIINKELAKVKE